MAEVKENQKPFDLDFRNPREGANLQARVVFLTKREILLEKLELKVDIAAHMRHVLRWYYDAWGRVSLKTGSFQRARQSFESLLALDPDFRDAYLPLAKTLLDSGQTGRAYASTKSAELLFRSNPEQLFQVRDLYQLMGKSSDVTRVDDRLAHLRPSLKLEARFAAGLELMGYDLPKAEVKTGDRLDVNYYWRCWSKPPMNYFIFVHLRGMDRTVTFDHLLDHGRQFMTELEPGQVIREDYQIRIPETLAPGEYKLVVGIWDPRFTGKGVPVIEGAGQGSEEVELAKVKVLP
jgi:tetratricopeptide (TPR) repeat protein